ISDYNNHTMKNQLADVSTLELELNNLRESTINAVWRQWHALGATAVIKTPARAVVDPEALVWMSLTLSKYEPRLTDLVASWTLLNSDLLSVQRINNLAAHFPDATHQHVIALARLLYEQGKDHRWK